MQYIKNVSLGAIMLMLIAGCSGLSVHGSLVSVEGIVVLPEPAPPQPAVVWWYQTSPVCCSVFIGQQWTWDYHNWHHHHHRGRPHRGYTPGSRIPRRYVYPPKR